MGDRGIFKRESKSDWAVLATCRLKGGAIKDLDLGIFSRAASDPV